MLCEKKKKTKKENMNERKKKEYFNHTLVADGRRWVDSNDGNENYSDSGRKELKERERER